MLSALLSPVDALLFPAPQPSYSDSVFPWAATDCLWLRDPANGKQFPAVVVEPADGSPPVRVVLYCHGNACDIGECYHTLKHEAARWRALVVLIEYPGYGVHPGPASAAGIDRHVRATYDHFTRSLGVHPSRVVVYGCSVGTGPASKLAASVQAETGSGVGALVLQSPYTTVRDAAANVVGGLAYWVVSERWDNAQCLKAVTCPVLVVHGTRDEVIPYSHGQALCTLRKEAGLKVDFHSQEGCSHNTFRQKEDLADPVAAFLRSVHPQGSALAVRPPGGGSPNGGAGSRSRFWVLEAASTDDGAKAPTWLCGYPTGARASAAPET